MEYEDFDIHIGTKQGDCYPLSVISSSTGQTPRPILQKLPKTEDFEDAIAYLEALVANPHDAKYVGQLLYEFLFPQEIRDLYTGRLSVARSKGKGLRIRLHIGQEHPELNLIPWEYCRDDKAFLALNEETPILRYIPTPRPPEPLTIKGPVKVLLVTANPSDLQNLNIISEEEYLRTALTELVENRRVTLRVTHQVSRTELERQLSDFDPHILHFAGHGDHAKDGRRRLFLVDGDGQSQPIDDEDVQVLLQNSHVRLILLNACQTAASISSNALTGVAPLLVEAGVPAVIGMQFAIPDETSITFMKTLYQSLVKGKPLDTAVTQARKTVFFQKEDKYFWGIPALFMRSPDGVLWSPLSSPVYQVPRKTGKLIGREKEIEKLGKEISAGGRIVVLHGIAGVGKTALAPHLASEIYDSFPDGVLWADLKKAVDDKGQLNESYLKSVLNAFATEYGLDLSNESELEARSIQIRALFADKKVLIILDYAHDMQSVEPLLPPSESACSILITSRNKSMFVDQATFLQLHPFTESEGLDFLTAMISEKRVLRELPDAKKIIGFVGGLPLALNIIASNLIEADDMPLAEYKDLLQGERDRLDQLEDLTDVSKGVRAAFELSYKRLLGEQKALFSYTSIFEGPDFSIEAIAAVAGKPVAQIRIAIARLGSLSLVETHYHESPDPVVTGNTLDDGKEQIKRYGLHSLLQIFAREKLRDDVNVLMKRATVYFIQLVQENCRSQYPLLALDWENIGGILQWTRQQKDWESFAAITDNLTYVNLGTVGFLDAQGYWREAQKMLEVVHESDVAIGDSLRQATILFKLGVFALRQAEFDTAEQNLQQSWSLLNKLPESEDVLLRRAYVCEFLAQLMTKQTPQEALNWSEKGIAELQKIESETTKHEEGYLYIRYATILGMSGQLKTSEEVAQKGLDLLPETPTAARVSAYMTLGNLQYYQGNLESALDYWNNGVKDTQALGDSHRLAQLQGNMASAKSFSGQYAGAVALYENVLAFCKQIGDVALESMMYVSSSIDYLLLGEHETSHRYIDLALEKARKHQMPRVQANALANRAHLQIYLDKVITAQSDLQEAHEISLELDDDILQAEVLRLQAQLTLHKDENNKALKLINESLAIRGDVTEEGRGWRVKGDILSALDDSSGAIAAYKKSADILDKQEPYELALTRLMWGRHYLKIGADDKAKPLLEQAQATFEKLDTQRELAMVNELLNQL